jgi:hypothetical protein
LIGFVLAASVALSAAMPPALAQPARADTVTPRYDAETLVRGLFFGIGPVAQRYPRLVLGDPDPGADTGLVPVLLAEAQRQSPGYGQPLAVAISSGDRVLASRAAGDTIAVLQRAIEALYPHLFAPVAGGSGTYAYTVNCAFRDTVVNTLIYVLLIVPVVVMHPPCPGFTTTQGRSDLDLERWVDLVVTTLSVA